MKSGNMRRINFQQFSEKIGFLEVPLNLNCLLIFVSILFTACGAKETPCPHKDDYFYLSDSSKGMIPINEYDTLIFISSSYDTAHFYGSRRLSWLSDYVQDQNLPCGPRHDSHFENVGFYFVSDKKEFNNIYYTLMYANQFAIEFPPIDSNQIDIMINYQHNVCYTKFTNIDSMYFMGNFIKGVKMKGSNEIFYNDEKGIIKMVLNSITWYRKNN